MVLQENDEGIVKYDYLTSRLNYIWFLKLTSRKIFKIFLYCVMSNPPLFMDLPLQHRFENVVLGVVALGMEVLSSILTIIISQSHTPHRTTTLLN